jgi:hypothetical protein
MLVCYLPRNCSKSSLSLGFAAKQLQQFQVISAQIEGCFHQLVLVFTALPDLP